MTLKLYNTLTRKKEVFEPQDASNVRMYVCGPTVYDYAHIGNARPVIVFDVLFRLLRHLYGEDHVTYARNITDVDDKIIARAADEDRAISELTEETTRQFHDDIRALGVLMPEDVNTPGAAPSFIEPKATEHIPQMIAMIERLIASGHAYEAEGHVLFDVTSKDDYGKLARRSLDEMEAGARVEVAPYKKGQMDFVLWKPSLAKQPGWESPWGRGRPGWHIECSAMSEAHLGESFDIHGGGIDLLFPHHENEVAQSECAHGGKPFARYWIHNGFLQVEGEKMSKSLGNFVTMRALLDKRWPGEVIRFAMLKTHYRQPINWTQKGLMDAALELQTFANWTSDEDDEPTSDEPASSIVAALSDDLNTPLAVAELHKLVKTFSPGHSDEEKQKGVEQLRNSLRLIGLGELDGYDANKIASTITYGPDGPQIDEARVGQLIAERTAARKTKDFKKSDEIRDQLAEMGIALKDGPDGTTWEVAR